MFNNKQTTQYDAAITEALGELMTLTADSEEYKKIIDNIDLLTKLKGQSAGEPLSKNTLVIVLGNLLGIGLIVGYEHKHVVTSKALNFVGKFK